MEFSCTLSWNNFCEKNKGLYDVKEKTEHVKSTAPVLSFLFYIMIHERVLSRSGSYPRHKKRPSDTSHIVTTDSSIWLLGAPYVLDIKSSRWTLTNFRIQWILFLRKLVPGGQIWYLDILVLWEDGKFFAFWGLFWVVISGYLWTCEWCDCNVRGIILVVHRVGEFARAAGHKVAAGAGNLCDPFTFIRQDRPWGRRVTCLDDVSPGTEFLHLVWCSCQWLREMDDQYTQVIS